MRAPLLLVCVLLAAAESAPQAHYQRGVKLIEQHEFGEAAAELDEALRLQPSFAAARHALGLVRLAQNDPAGAIAELRRAIQLKPSLAEAHLALGLALGQSGLLEEAAAEFRAAIQLRPKFAEAHKRLGITLRRQGDPKGALAEFQRAVTAEPKDPESWYHLGLARKAEGDLNGAIDAFRRAIAIQPDFEKAHYNLGIALRAQGHQQAGQKELAQVKGLHAFRSKLAQSKSLILEGVEALKQGDLDRALPLFERASELSPTLPTAWHYLGVAWDRKGDAAKALAAWRRALELEPGYPQAHLSLGVTYARGGDFERAAQEFRQAVMSDPEQAEAHYNLGLALARMGRAGEALNEFSEAVSLNPSYTDARVQLALALAAEGRLIAAGNVYRELIRQNPNFAEAYSNLGLVLLEDHNFAGAEAAFRQALKLGFAPARQNLELTKPCQVAHPTASLTVPHVQTAGEWNADPNSALWKRTASATILKDCTHTLDYPQLQTEVRAFWTDTDLYLLFTCPYRKLNVFLPAQNDRPRDKLWERDVVEAFLGDDWSDIRHYREFEIAPTGDWIDLAIDLNRNRYDRTWRSGWRTAARIAEKKGVWHAAARIPLESVSDQPVRAGTRWRMNLYRIEGTGPDAKRHFLCWQPTCVLGRDPNHVPENFGTLTFGE